MKKNGKALFLSVAAAAALCPAAGAFDTPSQTRALEGQVQSVLTGQASDRLPGVSGRPVAMRAVQGKPRRYRWRFQGENEVVSGFDCSDEKGGAGWDPISVEELLATKDGECAVLSGVGSNLLIHNGPYMPKADLSNANLKGLQIFRAYLKEANLKGADLRGAQMNDCDLEKADLQGADMTDALVVESDLTEAKLAEANLYRARLRDVTLARANLWKADLTFAVIVRSDLREADLAEAHMTALFEGDKFSRANLRGAWLPGSEFRDTSLDDAEVKGAIYAAEATDGHGGYARAGADLPFSDEEAERRGMVKRKLLDPLLKERR